MENLFEVDVRVESSPAGQVAVVVTRGEVDLSNADELEAALSSPSCSQSDGVLLDLRQLEFMDSSGLQTLLVAARGANGRFAVLLSEGTAVASLFEIAELSERFHTYADETEALAGIRAAADGGD